MNRPVDLLFDTLDFSLRVISYVYLRIFYYAIAGCFCSCFCLIFYPLANASHASRVTCPSPARRDLTRATCSFVFKPLPKHSLLRTLEFYDIEYNALSPVPYRHTLGGVPPPRPFAVIHKPVASKPVADPQICGPPRQDMHSPGKKIHPRGRTWLTGVAWMRSPLTGICRHHRALCSCAATLA